MKNAARIAAILLAMLGVVAVQPGQTDPTPPATPIVAAHALELLPTTTAPAPGYERSAFGSGWTDPLGPTCDTRQQVLARDLTDTETTRYCYIASGTLVDPYSGRTITGLTRYLDIDHTVALADAWRNGAAAWTPDRREAFANDLDNLVATTASANRSKGDSGPDEWSPLTKTGACRYAERYVAIKARYELGVTPGQRSALEDTLDQCLPPAGVTPGAAPAF